MMNNLYNLFVKYFRISIKNTGMFIIYIFYYYFTFLLQNYCDLDLEGKGIHEGFDRGGQGNNLYFLYAFQLLL